MTAGIIAATNSNYASVNAVQYNAVNSILTSTNIGVGSVSTGILSYWIYVPSAVAGGSVSGLQLNPFATPDTINSSLPADGGGYSVRIVIGNNFGGFRNLTLSTGTNPLAYGRWANVLASWNTNFDGNAKIRHFYINDINYSSFCSGLGTPFSTPYNSGSPINWYGNNLYPPAVSYAEIYFAPGQFLDFSITSNRRKFVTETVNPWFLGANGSVPTGTPPAVYFNNPYNNYGPNSGTGGAFTPTGTFVLAPSRP